MYADSVTDSMRTAIEETNRRRAIQQAFNEEHGIEPKTIRKAINDIVQYVREQEAGLVGTTTVVAEELSKMPREELMRLISTLEEDMHGAAESLDFEGAARMRDQVVKLRAQVEQTSEEEALASFKKGARRGSSHGVRRKRR
jgi:excinuclease ABC subunit B